MCNGICFAEYGLLYIKPDADGYWQIWKYYMNDQTSTCITTDPMDKRLMSSVAGESSIVFRTGTYEAFRLNQTEGEWKVDRILKEDDNINQCVIAGDTMIYAKMRSQPPDESDLWIKKGKEPARIIDNTAGLHSSIDVSSDGKRVLFVRGSGYKLQELYIADLDGEFEPKRLTKNQDHDLHAVFDPVDEKTAIFVSGRTGDYELWKINVNNEATERVTESAGLDTYPAWSPDGVHLAFISARDGESAVWIMDRDHDVQKLAGTEGAGQVMWIEGNDE